MQRTERNVISNIIAVYPYLYGWQDEIDKEQEKLIGDLTSPAKKVVERLMALDNMRVDLCNLKVLYTFMERDLGVSMDALKRLSISADSPLYDRARESVERSGFTLDRAREEFSYLFKRLPKNTGKRDVVKPLAVGVSDCLGAV